MSLDLDLQLFSDVTDSDIQNSDNNAFMIKCTIDAYKKMKELYDSGSNSPYKLNQDCLYFVSYSNLDSNTFSSDLIYLGDRLLGNSSVIFQNAINGEISISNGQSDNTVNLNNPTDLSSAIPGLPGQVLFIINKITPLSSDKLITGDTYTEYDDNGNVILSIDVTIDNLNDTLTDNKYDGYYALIDGIYYKCDITWSERKWRKAYPSPVLDKDSYSTFVYVWVENDIDTENDGHWVNANINYTLNDISQVGKLNLEHLSVDSDLRENADGKYEIDAIPNPNTLYLSAIDETTEEIDLSIENMMTRNLFVYDTSSDRWCRIGGVSKEYVEQTISNKVSIFTGTIVSEVGNLSENRIITWSQQKDLPLEAGDEYIRDIKVGDLFINVIDNPTGGPSIKTLFQCIDKNDSGRTYNITYQLLSNLTELEYNSNSENAQSGKAVSEAISQESEIRENSDKELEDSIKAINQTVDVLIGSDSNLSVREIASDELVKQLIPETAAESLDTLQEIADWIQSHPEDASAMNADITTLQNQLDEFNTSKGAVKKYIDDNIDTVNQSIDSAVDDIENSLNDYVLKSKSDDNYHTYAYAVNHLNKQTMMMIEDCQSFEEGSLVEANTLAKRNQYGNLMTHTPINDIDCANKQYVDLVSSKLDTLYTDFYYSPIAITNLKLNDQSSPSNIELGSTLTDVVIDWTTSKVPESMTLNGETIDFNSNSSGKITLSNVNITTSKTYTLSVVEPQVGDKDKATATKSITQTFCNGVYYGVGDVESNFDSDFIITLTKKLETKRANDFTVNPNSQYIYYCYPKSRGVSSFKVGGFEGGFESPVIVSFTNKYNYTEDYYIYRSTNKITGSTTVDVI